jgi:hypothetical protein
MENRRTSLVLKETIAGLTEAEKCREYTIERLPVSPLKTNRRDFRRANADRFISAKSVVTTKKSLHYGAVDPVATPELGPIRMALKATAVDSPTNLAQERHWAMIPTPANPARNEDQSRARTYLALNWQRRKIKTRFTWIEQRFPTPSPQWRNNREIRAVTTGHLLLAIHRRRASSLLPFSRPNSDFADSHSQRETVKRGGGGVRRAPPAKVLRWKSAHENFIPIGSPASFLLLSKKTRFEPWSNSKWSAPGVSRELAANHR